MAASLHWNSEWSVRQPWREQPGQAHCFFNLIVIDCLKALTQYFAVVEYHFERRRGGEQMGGQRRRKGRREEGRDRHMYKLGPGLGPRPPVLLLCLVPQMEPELHCRPVDPHLLFHYFLLFTEGPRTPLGAGACKSKND